MHLPSNRQPKLLRLSHWLFRCLLLAYPREHRAKYGPTMTQLFQDQCRDAWRDAGGRGIIVLWLRVFPDLLKSSFLEHLAHLKDRRFIGGLISGSLLSPSAPRNAFVIVFAIVFGLWFTTSVIRTNLLSEMSAHFGDVSRIRIEGDSADLPSPTIYDPYSRQARSATDVAHKLAEFWGKKFAGENKLKTDASRRALKGHISFKPDHVINRMDSEIEIRQSENGSIEVESVAHEEIDYWPSQQNFYPTLLGCTLVACLMGLLAGGFAALIVADRQQTMV
jgi:hypothetical protein